MRHQASVVAVALLVAACGSGNSTGPSPAPTPMPTPLRFSLSGIITDNTTAAPLAAATISISEGPNAGRSATSDSAGHYTMADLQSSRFTILVTREGYSQTTRSIQLNTNITHDVALDPELTGSWRGTVSLTSNGQRATSGLSNAQLMQTNSQLTGLLTAENGMSGSFNGSLDGGRFTGTLRIDLTSGDPNARCSGTSSATGPTTATTVSLSAPFLSLENCTGNVRDIEIRLTR